MTPDRQTDATNLQTRPSVSLDGGGFWSFLLARAVSILGDRFNELVIPLLVLSTTDSAFLAGLVGAANRLPALLFALWIGAIIDRSPKRRLMIAADAGRALAMGILVASLAFGWFSISLLIVVVFVAGIGDLIFLTAARPFLVGLVGRSNLVTANGRLETADAAATLTGPALGAFIIQTLGATAAIAANAASFAVSGSLLAALRHPEPSVPDRGSAEKGRSAFLAGLRALYVIPQQRVIQAVLAVLNFEAGAIVLLVVALGKEVLGLPAGSIGVILAGAGLGGLLTSIFVAPRLSHRRWGPVLATLLLTMAVATTGLALAGGAVTAFIANAALDGAVALAFVVAGATRQSLTHETLLGRLGASSFLINAFATTAGVFVAGALIGAFGGRVALALFGALFATTALYAGTTPWARERIADLQPIDVPPPNR